MIRRILTYLKQHSFSARSERRLYVALSTGILLGMLPLSGIRLFLLPLLSLVFSLNLLLMVLGVFLVTLLPLVHLLSFGVAGRISPHLPADFTSRLLSVENLVRREPGSLAFLMGSLVAALAVSLAILPLYTYVHRRGPQKASPSHTVFHDATGKRLKVVQRTRLLALAFLPVVVVIMGLALNARPSLPEINLEKSSHYANIPTPSDFPNLMRTEGDHLPLPLQGKHAGRGSLGAERPGKPSGHEVFAFYTREDGYSRGSLEENAGKIDVVVPDWFLLAEDLTLVDEVEDDVLAMMKERGIRVMPLVRNLSKTGLDASRVQRLIRSPQHTGTFARSLADRLGSLGASGTTIDFQNLSEADRDNYTAFIGTVGEVLHGEGFALAVTVPAGDRDAYDTVGLSRHADHLLFLLRDEHYATGGAGPLASQAWVEAALDSLGEVPGEKIVPVFGNYGQEWNLEGEGPARFLTFNEALRIAREGDLRIEWHEDRMNPFFRYRKDGSEHVVWFLDAATLYNGMQHALSRGITGVGLFALGTEDAGIWTYLGGDSMSPGHIRAMEVLEPSGRVQYTDAGDILRIGNANPRPGSRSFSVRDGRVVKESYDVYPEGFDIEKYGRPEGKKVALTFDDGPNRKYTPRILDILSKYNAHATFFVLGINAISNQELLERIYAEGHEIGNHTFTHADITKISDFRLKLELGATQRIIQDVIRHSTLMFRPPEGLDVYSVDFSDYLSISRTQDHGYTVVGYSIDPNDWAGASADEIYERVMDALPEGNVILLHDSGGNRESTVEALPRILEELDRQGYEFVTVSSLIGKSREAVMPAVVKGDGHFVLHTRSALLLVMGFFSFMGYVFLTTTVIGALRLLFLIFFSRKQHRKARKGPVDTAYRPRVSIVIAAYNEEKVIVPTVLSVLESTYADLEVIVVDDGSTDRTADAVREAFGANPQVVLLTKENGGKSSALNLGFRKAGGEVVVAFDADTVVDKEAVASMVSHFEDDRVGAVSGNVRVGNVRNLLTKWQHIEYVVGFNLERRAFAELDCITVVPGAIGAWRKAYVEACGYYKTDTLAEDTDMTIELLRHGYLVRYEEKAIAFTEAPEDLKSLMKQRYRWSYGILQSLWKHRDMLFDSRHKTLGFIAIPNMWLFQYVFQALSPIADIVMVFGLFSSRAPVFAAYYLVLLLVDYAAAIYAFRLEKMRKGVLVWLFLQRIAYRILMVYISLKAIFNAMKGMQVGWNKLKRRGSVRPQESAESMT